LRLTTKKTILALDLGKFKILSYLLTEDHSSDPVFKTIMTNPKTFEQWERKTFVDLAGIAVDDAPDHPVFPPLVETRLYSVLNLTMSR